MRIKKTASNVVPMSRVKNGIQNQLVSRRDIIRMKFLEQFARYLGVYVENSPAARLSDKFVN